MRAWATGARPRLRMPEATRPWQHVLDCIAGYLLYVEQAHRAAPRALNFGPDPAHPVTVGELTRAMLEALGAPPLFDVEPAPGCARNAQPRGRRRARPGRAWLAQPLAERRRRSRWTADWHRRVRLGESPRAVTLDQIAAYCAIETVAMNAAPAPNAASAARR